MIAAARTAALAASFACALTLAACGGDVDTGPSNPIPADSSTDVSGTPDISAEPDLAEPVDVPVPTEVGSADAGDVIALIDSMDAADLSPPDSGPDAGGCSPEGSFVEWSVPCGGAGEPMELVANKPLLALGLAADDAGGLLAWTTGVGTFAAPLGSDGMPLGAVLTLEEGDAATGAVQVVPTPEGWVVFYTRGTLRAAVVSASGSLVGAPTDLGKAVRLWQGGTLGPAGFRLWGINTLKENGETHELAMLVRVSADLEMVDGLHLLQNQLNFTYLQLHANEHLVHAPFQRTDAEHGVSYFLAQVTLPGCGLPIDSGVLLGAESELVASAYADDRSVWAIADPGGCPDLGAGRVLVLNTFDNATKEAPLPMRPSARAVLVSAGGQLVLMDARPGAGGLEAVGIQAGKMLVSERQALAPLQDSEGVAHLRGAAVDGGLLVAWATESGATRVQRVCP